ncbi:hypothetical protein [Parasphingopyxis marina]|uniref:Uncharacterized protein n=1 Tax=Parasphingopyxis marina TaxID=2761622 RepID=A0A842HX86_9SPHN|nr:hypothetical protein [Parasphingopyxis marina]MBC2777073.1 hypothetical protein [Parasphingopyxis marina]
MGKEHKTEQLSETELDDVQGGGDSVPVESFSLNFEKIKHTSGSARFIGETEKNLDVDGIVGPKTAGKTAASGGGSGI